MGKDPAFLFYSSDFLTGTILMTNEQIGIFIKLLCIQHQHGGLIDEDSFISLVNGHKSVLRKFKKCSDGYYNERLSEEMIKRSKKCENLSANAKVRWHKQSECKSNAIASDLHMPIENENEDRNIDINKEIGGTGGKRKKHKYGEYGNVLLRTEEYENLKSKWGNARLLDMIRELDEGIQLKGYKYKDHNLAIQKWEKRREKSGQYEKLKKVTEYEPLSRHG